MFLLTSHDADIDDFAKAVEHLGHILVASIRRESCSPELISMHDDPTYVSSLTSEIKTTSHRCCWKLGVWGRVGTLRWSSLTSVAEFQCVFVLAWYHGHVIISLFCMSQQNLLFYTKLDL